MTVFYSVMGAIFVALIAGVAVGFVGWLIGLPPSTYYTACGVVAGYLIPRVELVEVTP